MVIYKQHRFLVDCGEGTQRQLLKSGLGFKRLKRILLTHGHLDHILGLGGLVSTFSRWEAVETLEQLHLLDLMRQVLEAVEGLKKLQQVQPVQAEGLLQEVT